MTLASSVAVVECRCHSIVDMIESKDNFFFGINFDTQIEQHAWFLFYTHCTHTRTNNAHTKPQSQYWKQYLVQQQAKSLCRYVWKPNYLSTSHLLFWFQPVNDKLQLILRNRLQIVLPAHFSFFFEEYRNELLIEWVVLSFSVTCSNFANILTHSTALRFTLFDRIDSWWNMQKIKCNSCV